ncbi:hypothetical protein QR98_0087360 [Sarcoptes scabiei]|uniref:Uncharacterized protein n=1 Tax=Sarcoptes scabiei TaxID=52283 RepID=A0A132AGQ3_SARSC|nr:hypothetical protein QR98_0087360 [Sarcoptes scabiei]
MTHRYDDGLYGSMESPYSSMSLGSAHGGHLNHGGAPSMHNSYHNNNHVMSQMPDVHKRDKDAIYGYVFDSFISNIKNFGQKFQKQSFRVQSQSQHPSKTVF